MKNNKLNVLIKLKIIINKNNKYEVNMKIQKLKYKYEIIINENN